jgi:hypothetical protein
VESLLDRERVLDDVIVVEHRSTVHMAVVTGTSIGFPQIECSARSAGSSKLWRESVLKEDSERVGFTLELASKEGAMGGIAPGPRRELRAFPFSVARCSVGAALSSGPASSIKPTSPLGSTFLCDEMQPGTVLFLHLFCRNNSAAKVCELHKLMLDCL